jgi:hypothetical protein
MARSSIDLHALLGHAEQVRVVAVAVIHVADKWARMASMGGSASRR